VVVVLAGWWGNGVVVVPGRWGYGGAGIRWWLDRNPGGGGGRMGMVRCGGVV